MKVTAIEIFRAAVTLMSGRSLDYLEDVNDKPKDCIIQSYINIAKRTAELIDDGQTETHFDLVSIFKDFKWDQEGAKRTEIESYLKEKTGYTSNRVMQRLIDLALENGIIKKNLTTRKYHPGKKCPTA